MISNRAGSLDWLRREKAEGNVERERELLWKEWEDKRDDCLHGHEQNVVVSFCF